MKLRKRIMALALGILGCAGVLTTAAFAETGTPEKSVVEANTDGTAESEMDETQQTGDNAEKSGTAIDMHDGKLTVKTVFGTDPESRKPIDGINVSIYRIASIDENGDYKVTEDFKDAEIEELLSGIDLKYTDINKELQEAVKKYLDESEKPDEKRYGDPQITKSGSTAFEIPAEMLGLYYIEGDTLETYEGEQKVFYIPSAAIVSLPAPPNSVLETKYWDYLPTVNLKCTKGSVWIDPPVLKVIQEKKEPVVQKRGFTFAMESPEGSPLPMPGKSEWMNGTVLMMAYDAANERILDKEGKAKEGESGEPQEFGRVWFTHPGEYNYVIREVPDNDINYEFDNTVYHLHVKVKQLDDGTLGGEQWCDEIENGKHYGLGPGWTHNFEFTNNYTPEKGKPDDPDDPTKPYFYPYVRKFVRVTDRAIEKAPLFRFILEADKGTPMPSDSVEKDGILQKYVTLSVTQKEADVGVGALFDSILIEKPGTYKYTIYEDVTLPAPYVTFDKTRYELTVIWDGEHLRGTGKSITVDSDGKEKEEWFDWGGTSFQAKFTNTYTRRGSGGGGNPSGGGHRSSTPVPTTTVIPETEPEVIPGVLPKTGMLWWPVPVLAVAGIFLLAAGFILERRRS